MQDLDHAVAAGVAVNGAAVPRRPDLHDQRAAGGGALALPNVNPHVALPGVGPSKASALLGLHQQLPSQLHNTATMTAAPTASISDAPHALARSAAGGAAPPRKLRGLACALEARTTMAACSCSGVLCIPGPQAKNIGQEAACHRNGNHSCRQSQCLRMSLCCCAAAGP